jgi:hypothetical protein
MKRFVYAFLLTLLTGLVATAQPQAAGRTQTFNLDGIEVSRGLNGSVTLSGSAKGLSNGSFEIQLQYNPATRAVTGGTWKLSLTEPQSTLRGVIKSGVALVVRNGAGRFAGAAGVSGKLQGTLNAQRPQPFAGKFSLSF